MPHKAAASVMPMAMSLHPIFRSFHHPGEARVEYVVRIRPEQVIITQKFTYGEVHGENIIVQRMRAMTHPKTVRLIEPFIFQSNEFGNNQCCGENY